MKKILLFLGAVFASFSIVISASAQVAKPAESHGLLYKISGKNLKKPSYIYGTFHIICQTEMFGMDKLNELIGQSEQLLMEIDLDDPAVMQSMVASASMPDGKSLKDYLTPDQYAKVDEMFKNYVGVSVDLLNKYRPMMISVAFTSSPKVIGCQPPGSYDLSFMQTAVAKKIPVEGLETVALQLEKLDKKTFDDQAKELYEMALNPQKSIGEMQNIIRVYKTQNSEILYQTITGNFGGAEFEKGLLEERNTDWIPKIEKAIDEKGTFIAVGAGHLGGEKGVLSLLKKQGYTIESIKL